jgi:predicted lipoprotein with Yx(FWY)xxD motif
MGHVSRTWTSLLAVALVLGACGDDSPSAAGEGAADRSPRTSAEPSAQAPEPSAKPRTGTRIKVGDSEFGSMLFGPRDQAIYIFERDPKGKTVCYGECARAWPPVLTKGAPRAAKGVRSSLLGTVRRRGGKRQVTYAGKPLYYYAHEGPGEVRCHNVNLNGGFWWVVAPDGRRRP